MGSDIGELDLHSKITWLLFVLIQELEINMSLGDTVALAEALKENQALDTLNLRGMLPLLSIEYIYLPIL